MEKFYSKESIIKCLVANTSYSIGIIIFGLQRLNIGITIEKPACQRSKPCSIELLHKVETKIDKVKP